MRALVCTEYGPPEKLVIEQLADPIPRAGEVLVEIRAAGINFVDLLAIEGRYQIRTPPPFIPGNEAAGIVQAVGAGVGQVKPGDRVIITPPGGAFGGKCVLAEARCLPLPDHMSFEQGAGFILTHATAYHALLGRAALQPGETLLVLGAAGGTGIAAVAIAKALGAVVIAAASSDQKLEFARQAGADFTVNYSAQPLRDAVRECTGGEGTNVVFDTVGGDLAQMALRSLAWHGRYLVIGFASGEIPAFPANIALLKEASIIGIWWGEWAQRHPQDARKTMLELGAMTSSGKLDPQVPQPYPLEQYLAAFTSIIDRRALGKVVLSMS